MREQLKYVQLERDEIVIPLNLFAGHHDGVHKTPLGDNRFC